jgi:hypothetical protein
MKTLAILFCIVYAVFLSRLVSAADLPQIGAGKSAAKSALVEFAGFRLGQKLDVENAAVRAEWGLDAPARVVLANVKYEYLDCDTVGPTNGWDSVGVSVSLPDKKIVAIEAVVTCKDKESAEQRQKKVIADFKAKNPGCENEKGDKTFEASVSGTSVEASLSTDSFRAILRKNDAPSRETRGL